MAFYPTRNTLPEDIRLQAVDLLGKGLITAIDVQRHAKQAHWNVHGPNFIGLHLLFDEVHGAALAWADLCAERLVALGGTADGRVEHVAKQTPLNPYPLQVKSGTEHVFALAAALAAFGEQVRGAIKASANFDDATTSDLVGSIYRNFAWRR
ncbi:DNA starvation/stationary phase protection protein Dps [Undibacterium arcticum]|uniref:DNA starvation/stationary phase protection protein Dps n=1 Tax=Undibacterium arcticum TaxID=1762892 RepID=A0ABV7EVA2_9BURK